MKGSDRPAGTDAALGTAVPEEIARFQAMAGDWWDPEGDFAPLHRQNEARLAFLIERLCRHFGRPSGVPRPFEGLSLLDIGCGGGLLAEPLARQGFRVTGIDASEKAIAAARTHAERQGLDIDYRVGAPERMDGRFDVVTAMEIIEHVADPGAFLTAAAPRLRSGGAFLASSLNRTARSFALVIVGAEWVLRWIPRGTHDWRKFVRPSELARALRGNAITPLAFEGLRFDAPRGRWDRCRSLDVNYLVHGIKQ